MLNVVLINTTFDIGLALALSQHKYKLPFIFFKKTIEITEYAEQTLHLNFQSVC
jgi:hypothetical protein